MTVIYRCQDSLEGVFTGIYQSYEDHVHYRDAILSLDRDPVLFSLDREVIPDPVRAGKVARTLVKRFGMDNYEALCLALSSPEEDKAQAVYQTVAKGIERNTAKGRLLDDLKDPYVLRTFKIARSADREFCHLRGFARFEELEQGILYSEIKPKYNIIEFLMPHFADRFPMENFVLHDVGRRCFGLHPAGGRWYLRYGDMGELENSQTERQYQELFRHFCEKISIRERENPQLQRNMLPLHFREYMTEFQK